MHTLIIAGYKMHKGYIYIYFFFYDSHYSFLNYLQNTNINLHLNDVSYEELNVIYVCLCIYTHKLQLLILY